MREVIMAYDGEGEDLHNLTRAGELVRCRDCAKHNKAVGDVLWLEQACPLIKFRGKAQGHEFDYQYCAYGKRKEGC